MSRNLALRARPARRKTRFWAWAVLLALLAPVAAVGLAVETRPRAEMAPPDAAATRTALAAGERLRAFAESDADEGRISLREGEINALLASAGRLAPGLGGQARVEAEQVTLTLSAGAPRLPAGIWANVRVGVAAGPGLRVVEARVGRLPLPPRLAQAGLAWGLDLTLDDPGLARAALAGVKAVKAEGEAATLEIAFAPGGRAPLVARLKAGLNLSSDGAGNEPIWRHLYWLNRSGAEGDLPHSGSALAYLRHAVEKAERISRRMPELSDQEHAAAGLLALALYCGEPGLGAAVGVYLDERMRGEGNHCEGTTLGGRDDLKRHFLVSAGLHAAQAGGAVRGIGELKELFDSGDGGTGFSFDDMAANLAGARFAAVWLSTPKAEWPALIARIGAEGDVLPSLDGLPSRLSEAEFRARFGAVDSPDYAGLMAEIERRIDTLPFHRARTGG